MVVDQYMTKGFNIVDNGVAGWMGAHIMFLCVRNNGQGLV